MIIKKDFPLSQIVWYKIGGKVKYLLEAQSVEDVEKALDFIEKNRIKKVFVIGLGSNLIFPDKYFDGAVIRIVQLQSCHSRERGRPHEVASTLVVNPVGIIKSEFISVFAGTILDNLIQFSFANNLIGLEWAGGLPGTVGAGIRGNAGAFGKEIKDNLFSVDVLERKKIGYSLKTLKNSALYFSYRNSLIKENKNLIIISATFQLQPASPKSLATAKNIYRNNLDYRKKHHPIEFPTCGSVFKNITELDYIKKIITVWPDTKQLIDTKWHGKVSMGYMIERLSFSGYRVGDMQVSPKHTNFIVNLGGGRAQDVIAIIKEIQNKVQDAFGFIPEVEVEIISN